MAAQGVAAALPSPQAAGGDMSCPETLALSASCQRETLGSPPGCSPSCSPRRCGLASLPRACPTAPRDAVTLHSSLTSSGRPSDHS